MKAIKPRWTPGISAEDCVVSDLGIDPCKTGCLALEATQFMFYSHTLNPHCLVLLWQVAMAGDHTLNFDTSGDNPQGLALLTERLLQYYSPDHEIILYEASTMVMLPPRIERLPLSQLPRSKPTLTTTLVIPSIGLPPFDQQMLDKLGLSEAQILEKINSERVGE